MSSIKKSASAKKASRQPQDDLPNVRKTLTNKEQMFPFDDEKERLLSQEDQEAIKTTAMESNTQSDKMSGTRSNSDRSKYRLSYLC